MQLKTIQKISMICMLMLSFSIAQAQKYELKFQLKEGQTYQLKQSTDQVINISVMGMNQEVKQQNVFEYDYLVEKVEDGVQTVKVTYVAIESNRESVQGNSSYNSRTDKDPDNPESKYMAAMIGESFTMKIDQMGEVLEVNGTDALLDKGLAQMEGLDESTMSTVKAQRALSKHNLKVSLVMKL